MVTTNRSCSNVGAMEILLKLLTASILDFAIFPNIFIDIFNIQSYFVTYIHLYSLKSLCIFFIAGPAQCRETSVWVPGRESNLGLPYSSPTC